MNDKAYFVSDIHLDSMNERNGHNLLRFLHWIAADEKVCDLYLLGDIFDFWLSDHGVFVKKFEPLWAPLRTLKKRGSRLVYIEGNHDLHIAPFWGKKLGFEVYTEALYESISGFQVRLEHGDLINLNDEAYLKWRSLIRHPLVVPFGHFLPGRFWKKVGETLSEKSRNKSRPYRQENEADIRRMIHDHAIRSYQDNPFDVLISGHMHVKVDETLSLSGKKVRNINLGSWLEPEPQVLCLEPDKISWIDINTIPTN